LIINYGVVFLPDTTFFTVAEKTSTYRIASASAGNFMRFIVNDQLS